MAQQGQFESEWSPWRRGWLLPVVAWVFRVFAVGFIGYGVFSLVTRTVGSGIWKHGSAWPRLSPICMGGSVMLMTFSWRARTRKRGIVLLCIASLFMVIGIAVLLTSLQSIAEEISGPGVSR